LRREPRQINREYIFVHAYGVPWAGGQSLSQAIRNRLNALGIEGYTLHGLRKNAGMELAEAGATVEEIRAVLGHKTPKTGCSIASRRARRL
jgi:integrase